MTTRAGQKACYAPAIQSKSIRTILGFLLLVLSAFLSKCFNGDPRTITTVLVLFIAWLPAVYLTDKYTHKYPQRYVAYLLAQHGKAALLMALFALGIFHTIPRIPLPSADDLLVALLVFVGLDFLPSLPRRRFEPPTRPLAPSPAPTPSVAQGAVGPPVVELQIDTLAILDQVASQATPGLTEFLRDRLPQQQGDAREVQVIQDIPSDRSSLGQGQAALLVGLTSINDVRRLHQYLLFCSSRVAMGGYLAVCYLPLENVTESLKKRYPGVRHWPVRLAHFLWYRGLPKIPVLDRLYFSSKLRWIDSLRLKLFKGRNRALSKAETWGRLAFCGFQVIGESTGEREVFLIAKKTSPVSTAAKASYYMITSLEKVGLGGLPIYTHKIRTMSPFSEFLQKRVFEDNGLAATGKFANDFRLTDYGVFLRKYWLDELPQIYDWLRGELKLVGMRATSRHFMSLYPKELYDIYIQVKPGLIPPVFDENTQGFEQIVQVELTYLKRYWSDPIVTDARYFFQTFSDIVFRGIRSK